jgi:hypothetical protein
MTKNYLYLLNICPDIIVDYESYYECEKITLSPALEAAGYELEGSWYTGEKDSFGPLSRCINTDRGIVVYG